MKSSMQPELLRLFKRGKQTKANDNLVAAGYVEDGLDELEAFANAGALVSA